MYDLFFDLRFAVRSLRKRPIFTLAAVTVLGLGIGGATAIFSVVDGVLIQELPYEDPDGLVSIWKAYPPMDPSQGGIPNWDRIQYSYEDFDALREGTKLFEDVALYAGFVSVAFTGDGDPEMISVGLGTANLLSVIGVKPFVGRDFVAGEDGTTGMDAANVAILGYEFWQRRFGGDRSIIGESVTLGDDPTVVIGVLPKGFRLESFIVTDVFEGAQDDGIRDAWLPMPGGEIWRGSGNSLEVFGRPAVGVSLDQARAEVLSLLPTDDEPTNQEARVELRKDVVTGGIDTPLLLLFGMAGLLVLVACANVGGLLLGEAVGRCDEVAVRLALGATRRRIVRQFLTESVALGIAGSAVGVVLALFGTEALVAIAPPLPRLDTVSVSVRVMAFGLLLGLSTGVLFGLAPLAGWRGNSLGGSLGTRSRTSTPKAQSERSRVVVMQVSVTVVLLVAGGLMGRSLMNLRSTDAGFNTENLATFKLVASASRYPTRADAARFFDAVVQNMESVPGVISVSGSYGLPFPGGSPSNGLQIAGRDQGANARRRTVLPSYHETLNISLIEGRYLSRADGPDEPGAMVVSQSLANRQWPSESPIGASVDAMGRQWTVVGVVADVRHTTLKNPGEPTFYLPLAQLPRRNLTLVARTAGDATQVFGALREAVWRVDPGLPVTDQTTITELIAESTAPERYRAVLLGVFGVLATLLAGVGVFGSAAQTVAQRNREIGIRRSLGAADREIVQMVIRRSLRDVVLGTTVGIVFAVLGGRVAVPFLYGVSVYDPAMYLAAASVLLAIGFAAASLPAIRATRISPMEVVREQ